MTATQDDLIAELQRTIANLRWESDTARGERDALLVRHDSEYNERIEHQAATIDVLKAMSASPGDPQPVFDLIAKRARDMCGGYGVTVTEFDGALIQYRASTGVSEDPAIREAARAAYPMPAARDRPTGRAILDREIFHSRDHDAEPGLLRLPHYDTVKSSVVVPMVRGDVAIGALAMGSRDRGGFSDTQVDLLKTFAEQAVIAIGSAETYRALRDRTAELQQSIEYQAATIDVLKVMSSSASDTQPVFDIILRHAMTLCDARYGGLWEYDGEQVHFRAVDGHSPGMAAAAHASYPKPLSGANLGERVILEGQPIYVRDYLAEPDIGQTFRNMDHRSVLAVPLLRHGVAIGSISVGSGQVDGFTQNHIELLKTFAEQAVIAIGTTATFHALQRRTADLQESLEYQTATSDVLKVIGGSTFDLQPVFDTIVATAARLCEASYANITIQESDGFRVVAGYSNLPGEPNTGIGRFFPVNRDSITGRTVLARRDVHVVDVTLDPDYVLSEGARRAGMRSVLGVPLIRDDVVVGTLNLGRIQVRPFAERQIELVRTFADQAVIAIENTRLLSEQREALELQTATAEIMRAINDSPGNLTPVFQLMVDRALQLCGASAGSMGKAEGDVYETLAVSGMPEEYAQLRVNVPGRHGLGTTLWAMRHGVDVEHHPDLMDTEGYRNNVPVWRYLVDVGRARASLAVAMRKDDVVLGMITIQRREPGPFSDRHIARLRNFADQAVVAMENARLINEQREALEQQTATAEVLQVINASPGDLVPVFNSILEKSMRLCEAAFGALYTYDDEHLHPVATQGLPAALVDYHSRNPAQQPPLLALQVVEAKRPILVQDLREGEGYRSGHPGSRAVVELGGARTVLLVPLLKEQMVAGFIQLYRQEVRAFTDKQIALLENFASQAVIAMENGRLLNEQREALERQTATAEVLQVINASPGELRPVFDAMLEKAMRLCDAAAGALRRYDGEAFHAVAKRGVPEAFVEATRLVRADPDSALGRIARGERVVQIADISEPSTAPDAVTRSRREMVELGHIRTALWVALRKDDLLLGVFVLYRNEVRPFTDRQVVLVENFAAQAVIAMENARLLTEQREALEQQTATTEVLQVINASPGNLTPVFDSMLEKAMRLCEAAFGSLFIHDGSVFHPVAMRGVPAAYASFRADRTITAHPGGPLFRILETMRTDHIVDMSADPSYATASPDLRAVVDLGGARTMLRVPLVKDRVLRGVITIYRKEVRPFSDRQIALLESFAAQAVIAIENARLLGELRTARDAAETSLIELKAAQANLIQAEKMASLGQLTAGIAHEIKNPLNFVNNFAALSVDLLSELKETAAPGFAALTDDQRVEINEVSAMLTSNLEKITEHGKRADGIVKAMLEHSRGASAERRTVDINELADEALNLAYHGARAQDQSFNVALERDFGDGIAPIEVNPQDITRVLLNLFSNGFYAANKRAQSSDGAFRPTLTLTTRAAGDAAEIRVRDNGTGIREDIRDKLFQPFFTTKPTGEGTGLGLSITYDIVTKAHGGTISVDSEVDEFTEFIVTLPRVMFTNEASRL